MAKTKLRARAEKMRKEGYSYSMIQKEINVSKSTLSSWLKDMQLGIARLRELRDFNPERIEKTRKTKLAKKANRRNNVLKKVKEDFKADKRDLFKEGFYLYWGEGTKTAEYTVALTSSDPSIIKCFIAWLELLGVKKSGMKAKVHMYSDQIESEVIKYWTQKTTLKRSQFYKTYIKQSSRDQKTYKGTFGHGTCSVLYHNRDVYEYVMSGIKYLRELHS